jgi:hypothetical protein
MATTDSSKSNDLPTARPARETRVARMLLVFHALPLELKSGQDQYFSVWSR